MKNLNTTIRQLMCKFAENHQVVKPWNILKIFLNYDKSLGNFQRQIYFRHFTSLTCRVRKLARAYVSAEIEIIFWASFFYKKLDFQWILNMTQRQISRTNSLRFLQFLENFKNIYVVTIRNITKKAMEHPRNVKNSQMSEIL